MSTSRKLVLCFMYMKKYIFGVHTIFALLLVTLTTVALFSLQQVQAAFKKGVTQGESIRLSESNACSVTENSDTPHFSGCSSIL